MAGMGDLRKFESTQQSDVQDWRIKDEDEEEQGSGAGQAFTAAPRSDPWGVAGGGWQGGTPHYPQNQIGIDATADAYVRNDPMGSGWQGGRPHYSANSLYGGGAENQPENPMITLPEPALSGAQVGSGSPWYMYEGIGSPLTFGAAEPTFITGQEKSWNGEAPSVTMIPNRPITQADMAQTQADMQKWNAERQLPGYGAGADTLQGQVFREAQMVNNQVPTFRDAGANYLRSGPARTTDEATKKVITPVKKKLSSGGSRGGAWGSRANSWQEILNSMNWKIS